MASLLLWGCTGGTDVDDPGPEPSLGPIPALESTAEIRLPLDAYELTYDERVAIGLAEARLTRACAARFGVDYPFTADHVIMQALPSLYFDANKNRHAYLYYLNDLAVAREHGYLIPPGLPPVPATEPPPFPADEDVFARVVLFGLESGPVPPQLSGGQGRGEAGPGAYPTGVERPVDTDGNPLPPGGCGGEAVGILAGDGELHDFYYANEVGGEAYFRALDDSRVVDVTRRWSECMAGKGYDYPSPEEATSDPDWPFEEEALRPYPEEIVAAVADVECKQSVNYLGTRFAVDSAYQELAIEEHFQDLEQNYRNAQEMLRRANDLAAGSA